MQIFYKKSYFFYDLDQVCSLKKGEDTSPPFEITRVCDYFLAYGTII